MPVSDVKTISEKLSVLLYVLTSESPKSITEYSLEFGDAPELRFPETGFRTFSDLSDYINENLPSLSEASLFSKLKIVNKNNTDFLPLREINLIFDQLVRGKINTNILSDAGRTMRRSLDNVLGSEGESLEKLEKYIGNIEKKRKNMKPAKSKPKDALPVALNTASA